MKQANNLFLSLLMLLALPALADNPVVTLNDERWPVTVFATDLNKVDNLHYDGDGVIFATLEISRGRGKLVRVTTSGVDDVVDGLSRPDGLLGDKQYFYLTEETRYGRILEYHRATKRLRVVLEDLIKPEGIDRFSNGDLVVAEDSKTGRLLRLNKSGKLSVLLADLNRPEGLCVDANDKVYIAVTRSGTIETWQDGQHKKLIDGLNKPDQIECEQDGTVWITEDSKHGRLLKYRDAVLTVVLENLSYPQGIALAANGDVFVAEQGKNRILKISRQKR